MSRTASSVIPTMRYRDAAAAIDWLCETLGFEKHLVVPGDNGVVPHAQLVIGGGMVMLGSVRDDEVGELIRQPDQNGVTQSAYIVVPDIEEHYEHAKSAGAEIVHELEAQDYGGQLYGCRDPEGHLWYCGSYDPWEED